MTMNDRAETGLSNGLQPRSVDDREARDGSIGKTWSHPLMTDKAYEGFLIRQYEEGLALAASSDLLELSTLR